MAKRPSFQFYPSDWLRDISLRSCSIEARGLWMDMLCFMHEGSEYGYLKIGKRIITAEHLAPMVGVSEGVMEGLLKELKEAEVFSIDKEGCMYSRRMVRDEEVRRKRAEGGKKGASYGKLGGRPVKTTPSETPYITPSDDSEGVDLERVNNPPSSSSSNSIIYIKEGKDFFRIGMNLIEMKPSEYISQNMKITIDKFMMTLYRGLDLKKIYEALDLEYFGYEFDSENHLRNTFKTVAEKLKRDKTKGKNTDESTPGFVLGQKPRGAVRHE